MDKAATSVSLLADARGTRYAALLEQRTPLRFGPELEKGYRCDQIGEALPFMRLGMGMAVVFLVATLLLDAATVQRFQHLWLYTLLWGLCLPAALTLLLVTLRADWRGAVPVVARLTAVIGGLALAIVAVAGHISGLHLSLHTLILFFLYAYFLCGLTFREAAPIATAVLLAYSAGTAVTANADPQLAEHAFFAWATWLLCTLAGVSRERADRRRWLQARLLQSLVRRDGLTGLYNHRAFRELTGERLRYARRDGVPVAMLLLDIDHFKHVNDRHGHQAGDLCLRQLAVLLQDHARRPLDVIGRLGGEEFALLLYATRTTAALTRAEKLRAAVEQMQTDLPAGEAISFTVSIGAAIAEPEPPATTDTLIAQADTAMYQAKRAGRNAVRLAGAQAVVAPDTPAGSVPDHRIDSWQAKAPPSSAHSG
jgi:diguanylate cyclase (GGDEF)-like protein